MGARTFKVDARTMIALGRESIKQHTTALVELVKNSYDAGSKVVEINVHTAAGDKAAAFLRVSDAGCGMTDEQLEQRWLRIGYSEKRGQPTTGKRRKTGEKGIGRISADRLGGILELRTKAKNSAPVGLSVVWDDFDKAGTDLEKIALGVLEDMNFSVPHPSGPDGRTFKSKTGTASSLSGTELTIRQVRDSWTVDDCIALRDELSIFTSPFHKVQDFEIRLVTDLDPQLNGVITSSVVPLSEVEVKVVYRAGNSISYEIWDRDKVGTRSFVRKDSIEIAQVAPLKIAAETKSDEDDDSRKTDGDVDGQQPKHGLQTPTCGPVEIRLLFLPRKATTVRATKLSLSDLKQFLDKNAGIRIYRDNIRVKPYGDPRTPEGDWLRLGARKAQDPAGAARKTFRAAPNQLVGGVFLTRDNNPKIADSSSREGLVHGAAFEDLRRLVLGALRLLETHYHEGHQKRQEALKAPVVESVEGVRGELQLLSEFLTSARNGSEGAARRDIERSIDHLNLALNNVRLIEQSLDETSEQATIFRGLATLGIAAAVFAHETESSINSVVAACAAAGVLINEKPVGIKQVASEIDKAVQASRRVAAWGHFALTRVRQDKRRRKQIDVEHLARSLVTSLKPTFRANEIDLNLEGKPTSGLTFPMDIESVLINLLTNAYEFCRQSDRKRQVTVYVEPLRQNGKTGVRLAVGDSGSGVNKEFEERVWEPLFTTRTVDNGSVAGTGLGLSIVQSVVDDHKGSRGVSRDPKLKGALFSVWLPLG